MLPLFYPKSSNFSRRVKRNLDFFPAFWYTFGKIRISNEHSIRKIRKFKINHPDHPVLIPDAERFLMPVFSNAVCFSVPGIFPQARSE